MKLMCHFYFIKLFRFRSPLFHDPCIDVRLPAPPAEPLRGEAVGFGCVWLPRRRAYPEGGALPNVFTNGHTPGASDFLLREARILDKAAEGSRSGRCLVLAIEPLLMV